MNSMRCKLDTCGTGMIFVVARTSNRLFAKEVFKVSKWDFLDCRGLRDAVENG